MVNIKPFIGPAISGNLVYLAGNPTAGRDLKPSEPVRIGKAERQITVEQASGPRGSRSNPQIRKVAGRS